MVHGVIIREDNKRIERDYLTMDEYFEDVEENRRYGLRFVSADTIRVWEIKQGRRYYG